MLFHPVQRKLFIFAGQRSKEFLNDFLTYDVDLDRVEVITCEGGETKRSGGSGDGPSGGTASPSCGTGESDRDDELALKEEHLVLNSTSGGVQPPASSSSGAGVQSSASSSSGVGSVFLPAAGLTQRATLDPDLDEIHVLSGPTGNDSTTSGLSKEERKREETVKNSFWIYSIPMNRWTCVYKNENQNPHYWDKMLDKEPCPRFAHQLVFDHIRKVHFLFGGNPGKTSLPKMRLDDFWALKLVKPNNAQVLKKCVYLIRKYRFLEMVKNSPLEATAFLQTNVSAVVNHESEDERKQFHLLASRLFAPRSASKGRIGGEAAGSSSTGIHGQDAVETDSPLDVDDDWRHRTELFDLLVAFYPERMTQPKDNLVDLVVL